VVIRVKLPNRDRNIPRLTQGVSSYWDASQNLRLQSRDLRSGGRLPNHSPLMLAAFAAGRFVWAENGTGSLYNRRSRWLRRKAENQP